MDKSKQIKFNQWSKPKQPMYIHLPNEQNISGTDRKVTRNDDDATSASLPHSTAQKKTQQQLHTHEYVKCLSVYMHVYLCTYNVYVCAKSSVQTACS